MVSNHTYSLGNSRFNAWAQARFRRRVSHSCSIICVKSTSIALRAWGHKPCGSCFCRVCLLVITSVLSIMCVSVLFYLACLVYPSICLIVPFVSLYGLFVPSGLLLHQSGWLVCRLEVHFWIHLGIGFRCDFRDAGVSPNCPLDLPTPPQTKSGQVGTHTWIILT